MKLWRPGSFIPLHPLSEIVKEKAESFPKNVIFLWGSNTYLASVKGDMLQDFFANDENLNSQVESTYVHGAGHNSRVFNIFNSFQ